MPSFGKIEGNDVWRKYCSMPNCWMPQPAPQMAGSYGTPYGVFRSSFSTSARWAFTASVTAAVNAGSPTAISARPTTQPVWPTFFTIASRWPFR